MEGTLERLENSGRGDSLYANSLRKGLTVEKELLGYSQMRVEAKIDQIVARPDYNDFTLGLWGR